MAGRLYSTRQWQRLSQSLRGLPCYYCRQPADTADHLLPLHTHPELGLDPTNIVPACRRCNSSKQHYPAPPAYRNPRFG